MKAILFASAVSAVFGTVQAAGNGMPAWAAAAEIVPGSNPYEGVHLMSDPGFAKQVSTSVARLRAEGDSFADKISTVSDQPVFVWLATSEIAEERVDEALKAARKFNVDQQKAGGSHDTAPLVQFVIYNVPDRDCSAGASTGEYSVDKDGLKLYKKKYIDRIARAFRAYPDVRIAAILEPDAVPNMVINANPMMPRCEKAKPVQIEAIRYAISQLQFPNVALYLDAGHAGWLGWEGNQNGAATVIDDILGGVPNNGTIHGYSINVSNYIPVRIPNITWHGDPALGHMQWNLGYDNFNFATQLGKRLAAKGRPSRFIADTARSGVYPIPGHTNNWCNIKGAGLGTRPGPSTPEFASALDAFVWGKIPGESDGTTDTSGRFSSECVAADALQPAPEAGKWFHEYFVMLAKNANPAL